MPDPYVRLAKAFRPKRSSSAAVMEGEIVSVLPLIMRANGIELRESNMCTVVSLSNLREENIGDRYILATLNPRKYVVLGRLVT